MVIINQENVSLKQSIERLENEIKLIKDNHLIEINNLKASLALSNQELFTKQSLLQEKNIELEKEKENNAASTPTPIVAVFDINDPSPEVLTYVQLQVNN